jgi:hypothetical protein
VQIKIDEIIWQIKRFYPSLRLHRLKKPIAFAETIWFRIIEAFNKLNEPVFYSAEGLLSYFRNKERARFFLDIFQKEACMKLLSEHYKAHVLAEADKILQHQFLIFGQTIHFKDKIDWHSDPINGHHWQLKYYKRLLPVFNTIDNSDGKVPYELSRFSHLSTLGMAYWITGDEKYPAEFINEIELWLDNNPYPYGINWTCAMDVAIRVCNMLLGLHFFKYSQNINNKFILRMTGSLLKHGRFIMKNLEYASRGITTNHYLADITGLVYLGTLLREFEEAERWRKFGINELVKEMRKQVYTDGCDFESSTCYHRLVLELFFFSTLIVVINDNEFEGDNYKEICRKNFKDDYTNRLYKMFEAVLHLLKPSGQMPQIGDNDSGRLHSLGIREVLDMRYLLSLGAIFFKEPKFKIKEYGFSEEALWVFGNEGHNVWQSLAENCLANIKSRSYADAGWYLMRNNNDYCLISCGWNGGSGVHSHNDKVSFELTVNGHDIIVDPGTYVYTPYPMERNKFRSTEYHNTLKLDGYEQNDIPDKNMFCLPDKVKILCAELVEDDDKISFHGEISYKDVTHKRVIILDKKASDWQIVDNFSCSNQVKAKWTFHLSPHVITDGNVLLTKAGFEKIASIEVLGLEMKKEFYDYSPEYGVRQMAECLFADVSAMGTNQNILTHIRSAR